MCHTDLYVGGTSRERRYVLSRAGAFHPLGGVLRVRRAHRFARLLFPALFTPLSSTHTLSVPHFLCVARYRGVLAETVFA